MEISFKNKVVLITGASEGIGFAIARAFGQDGAKVAICGRSQERLDQAVERLHRDAIEVFAQRCDVSVFAQFKAFADAAEEALGPIDVFINNAGCFPFCQIKDMDEALWDTVIDTNLKSVFLGAKIAFEKMQGRGGVFLSASSFASKLGGVGYAPYAVSKRGINALTQVLAAEFAPYNIRVLAYAPGVTDTGLTQEMMRKHGADGTLNPIALHRVGQPEDIARVVEFMASDYAGYVSGSVVEVDGGKFCAQNPHLAWNLKE